jgi:putative transposase
MVAVDFAVVPTVTGQVLFVFVVLGLARRRVLHVSVTAHPTAAWTGQQMVEAFPWAAGARYVIRDRDGIYGEAFRQRVKSLGLQEVLTAAQSPWQNGYAERFIGSLRRECLDHVVVLNARHLGRVVCSYVILQPVPDAPRAREGLPGRPACSRARSGPDHRLSRGRGTPPSLRTPRSMSPPDPVFERDNEILRSDKFVLDRPVTIVV